jgi:hypothetical protein
MPFTKVVEDWEIYNFAIHCLDHSCSKIWRYAQLKGLNGIGPTLPAPERALMHATSRHGCHAGRPSATVPHAETGHGPPVRAMWTPPTCAAPPCSPCLGSPRVPTALPDQWPRRRTGRRSRTSRPPHRPRRALYCPPHLGVQGTPNRLEARL